MGEDDSKTRLNKGDTESVNESGNKNDKLPEEK